MNDLTIGALARATGTKVPTIRYYEDIGLLEAAARTESNRRSFGAADVDRLNFIRHARDLGFSIDDIRALIRLSEHPESPCHDADQIARRQLQAVEARIARLEALRAELRTMIAAQESGHVRDCRVITALGRHAECDHGHDHDRAAFRPL